jgi:serine/threonine protein kinase
MSSEEPGHPRSSAADYDFLEKLGRGNSGTVFKVRRRSDKKFYVVKQVRKHYCICYHIIISLDVSQVDIGCVSAEEQAEALNECSILASMNHPNVVQCAPNNSSQQPSDRRCPLYTNVSQSVTFHQVLRLFRRRRHAPHRHGVGRGR